MPLHSALYYSVFTALFILLLVALHRDSYGRRIPYLALVLLLVLFNGLRYYVGWDYHIYLKGYQHSESIDLLHMEPFWQSLRAVMHSLQLPVEVWFMLTATFIVVFSLRAYRLQSYSLVLAILTYVVTFNLYFESFTMVRQSCAQAVVLFAFPTFRDKKYWQTLVILLIAFTLHRTAAMMVLLLPLCFIRIPRWLVVTFALLAVSVLPYLVYWGFELLTKGGAVSHFYIHERYLYEEVKDLGIAILVRIAFVFYFLWRERDLLKSDRSLRPFLNAFYASTLLNLVLYRVFVPGTATRFALYLMYTTPILLSNVFVVGKRIDRWAVVVLLLFELTITIQDIYTDDTRWDRYHLYDTIFFDKEMPMQYPGKDIQGSLTNHQQFIPAWQPF